MNSNKKKKVKLSDKTKEYKQESKEGVLFDDDIENYSLKTSPEFEKDLQMIEHLLINLLSIKGDLKKVDGNGDCPFVLAYKISDKSFFLVLLEQCSHKLELLNNVECQSLLRSIVSDGKWNILISILDKCHINDSNEDFFVQLSLLILEKNEMDMFRKVIRKYFQSHSLLHNAESFLTNAIKNNVGEDLLIKIIKSACFNVNESNASNETPLILVCNRLMVDVVKVLIQHNCDIKYDNNGAVRVVMSVLTDNSKENLAKATQIMQLLVDPSRDPIESEVSSECDSLLEILSLEKFDIFPSTIKKVINDIIRLLVSQCGNITKVDNNGDTIISLAYRLPYKQIFSMFVDKYLTKLTLTNDPILQSLLTSMIFENEFELVKNVLNKCVTDEDDDGILLSLALLMLKRDQCDMCKFVLLKCSNRNKLLNNNETFVTNLFNENIARQTLIGFFEMQLFDLNVPNGAQVTSLIIASERLWPDVVASLLHYGSDISFQNYRAIEVAIMAASNEPEKYANAKNDILGLFFGVSTSASQKSSKRDESMSRECTVSEIQFSASANYPVKKNLSRRSSRTSLLEMFLLAFFAKSDYLDFLFNWQNGRDNREIKKILSEEIVYPLRKYGFIDYNRILTFVDILVKQNIFTFAKDKDIDMPDVSKFFTELSAGDNLLSLMNVSGSITGSFYLSLIDVISESVRSISVQDLFNLFMLQQNKIFAKIPTCLVLEVARATRGCCTLNYVIPTSTIIISDVCADYDKRCYICHSQATFSCYVCIKSSQFNAKSGCMCHIHKCQHKERKDIPSSSVKSKSDFNMKLKAIICNENEYFVVFIKDEINCNRWLSFRSDDDSSFPSVTFDDRISKFLSSSESEKRRAIFGRIPRHLRQILNDSYLFIYENSSATCY